MAGLVPFNRKKADLSTTGFEDFYNMLDDFFTDGWPVKRSLSGDTFKVDVSEDEKNYYVDADLPGINKEELNVSLDEGRLTISVKRNENTEEKKPNYIHRERRCCSMQRSIFLSEAEPAGIKAKLDNGELKITVPKKEKKDTSVSVDIE